MKSPADLRAKLIRQWQSADLRESRLLGEFDWPIRLSIGKPAANVVKSSNASVREHLQKWRSEKTGRVEWIAVKYQATGSAVEIPSFWFLQSLAEWVSACNDQQVTGESAYLQQLLPRIDQRFHVLLVRQRSVWKNLSVDQLVQCCELAMQLEPGCAQGSPIRALTMASIDSKFIENHRAVIIKLLNERFNQALQHSTLEEFLGAAQNNDHWLLVIPLSAGLLPFEQMRLRASELAEIDLPCSHILVVENEQCRYQLPELENTIAILGAGLNLGWLGNPAFNNRQLAYWGDIDSWGLKMLGMARKYQPGISALLMDEKIYLKYQDQAVIEKQTAGMTIPESLSITESKLYQKLVKQVRGRLEQEFIDINDVHRVLFAWHHPVID